MAKADIQIEVTRSSDPDFLVDLETMAARLAIEPEHLRKLVQRGVVPATRLSTRCHRFHPATVIERLLEANTDQA